MTIFGLAVLFLLVSCRCSTDLQSELMEMQGKSTDGVVHLDMTSFQRFAVGKSRPYSLVFLFLAEKLLDKPKLGLRTLRKEFGRTARAYREKYPTGSERAGKVFFVTVMLDESSQIFERLGVSSLPYVFRLAPHATIKKSGSIEVPSEEKMTFDRYSDYPWKADAFADFVKVRTGVPVGSIPREDMFGSRLSVLFAIFFLGSTVWSAIKLYRSPIVRNKYLWMIGAVIICWFSTSGAMFIIIRGMPFVLPKDGKVQLFYRGNGNQLGAEGFLMGTIYILFSSGLLVMTYGPPKIVHPSWRRLVLLAAVVVEVMLLRQVVFLYKMKTGYPLQQYMF